MSKDKRRWTTQEQLEWLQKRHPDYLDAQSKGRYDRFWPGLFQDWFNAFPAREPTADDPTDSEPGDQPDHEHESEVTPAGKKVSYRSNIKLASHDSILTDPRSSYHHARTHTFAHARAA